MVCIRTAGVYHPNETTVDGCVVVFEHSTVDEEHPLDEPGTLVDPVAVVKGGEVVA